MWDAISLDCPSFTGYRVVHNTSFGNITMMLAINMTSVMITNLHPFTNTTVFVAAISDMGFDGPDAVVVETTLLQGEQHDL